METLLKKKPEYIGFRGGERQPPNETDTKKVFGPFLTVAKAF
jgi:hypothetical protein